MKDKYGNKSFLIKGYYVSTVGLYQKTIVKYIREQEPDDQVRDNVRKQEYVDHLNNFKEIRL